MAKMGEGNNGYACLVLVVMAIVIQGVRSSDSDTELEDCAPQLMTLQTCLQFVSGKAQLPTPNCCQALNKLVNTQPKCLCVLVKDHDSPLLDGFAINLEYAAMLPKKCDNADADINKCPKLLGLDPNSTDAKFFKDLARNATHTSNNTPTTLITNPSKPVENPAISSSAMSHALSCGRWYGFDILCGISIWMYSIVIF